MEQFGAAAKGFGLSRDYLPDLSVITSPTVRGGEAFRSGEGEGVGN